MEFIERQLSKEKIEIFIKKCDHAFVPLLSSRVNLSDYSQKLADKATHFLALDNHKLRGVICCYTNDLQKKSVFLSLTCISPGYQGKGIGKKLTQFFIDKMKEKKFRKIRFEVAKGNISCQEMYKHVGFKIVEEAKNAFFMELQLLFYGNKSKS